MPDQRCSDKALSVPAETVGPATAIQKTEPAEAKASPSVPFSAIATASPGAVATDAPASDDLKLCAIRFGQCTCRSPADRPGEWTVMPEAKCTGTVSPRTDTRPATGAIHDRVKSTAAAPQTAPKKSPLAAPKAGQPAAEAAQVTPPASAPAGKSPPRTGMSDCAMRDGACTCKAPDDGPGQWTLVDGSRCKLVLLSNLSSAPATPLPATKPIVRDVQKLLANLGYDAGPADGTLTPRTVNAIKSFQDGTGMPADGKVTDLLVARLRQLQAVPASAPKTGPNARVAETPAATSAASAEPAAAAPSTQPSGDFRLCAVRFGQCSCRGPNDGPGQWTPVDEGMCKAPRQ